MASFALFKASLDLLLAEYQAPKIVAVIIAVEQMMAVSVFNLIGIRKSVKSSDTYHP